MEGNDSKVHESMFGGTLKAVLAANQAGSTT
jgi:hypothetical protein